MSVIKEFKDFIVRDNILDLAVAFVMGAAFNAVVTALVTDIVTPIIGIPGHVNFASLTYSVNGSTFLVGAFINSIIAFLSIAIAVFFFIIKPASKLAPKKQETAPQTKTCPYCLSQIQVKATKCAFCTSSVK
ncbi:MAG: large conductance mechanosensitive channel protein MscL [Candidatus Marsarchaeota archaeon]|nr:large conductance mechanosensitive channel protein MscL [Candidatus Marsarchaeota archaeon]